MSCKKVNCAVYDWRPVPLDPDPDISGIGVLAAFLGAAWMTFLSLAVHYVAVPLEHSSNPLDRSLQRAIRRVLRLNSETDWSRPLRTLILAVSDQQLITGLAILIGAYSQFNCGISLYHWRITTNLAWFASVTHLATLPFLQDFLERHRYLLCIRVLLMSGLAIMLAVALFRNGDVDTPVMCGGWANSASSVQDWFLYFGGIYMVVSGSILMGTLVSRLLRMFSRTSACSLRFLRLVRAKWRGSIIWLCKRLHGSHRLIAKIGLLAPVLSLSAVITVQALLDFMRSRTWEVLWLLFCLIWGMIRLFGVRSLGPQITSDMLEENYLGFGQIIPVLFLFVPVLMAAESWSGIVHTPCLFRLHLDAAPRYINAKAESRSKEDQYFYGQPEQLQLPDLRDSQQTQSQHDLPCHSPAPLPAVSSIKPPLSPSDSTCTRIISLCAYDFRLEPWYLDNQYFMVSLLIGAAPIYLWFATKSILTYADPIGFLEPLVGVGIPIGSFFPLLIIPFCGVVDVLASLGSQKHALSIIRITTDPGKAHWIARRVYYYFCPTFVILFAILGPSELGFPGSFFNGVFAWSAFYLLPFLPVFFGATYSLYSQA